MGTIEHIETVMAKLSESPLQLFYWFFVPIYFIFWILFEEKYSDPMGNFKHLTEHGMATYD